MRTPVEAPDDGGGETSPRANPRGRFTEHSQPTGNLVLDALEGADFRLLEPYLELVVLRKGQVLCRRNEEVDYVYFPRTTMVLLIRDFEDGNAISVGAIGRRGGFGMSRAILGPEPSLLEARVAIAGTAYRIELCRVREAAMKSQAFELIVFRAATAFRNQVLLAVGCNGRHSVKQRIGRWLLAACSCANVTDLPLSQELLALALGTRRASVSGAIAELKRLHVISTRPGHIVIEDSRV